MTYKICKKCGVEKTLESFSKGASKYGRQSYCKPCFKETYFDKRPITDILRLQKKEYMKNLKLNNPMMIRRWDWKKLNINITEDEYTALHKSQEGRCAICNRDEQELKKQLVVDHCHSSGKIRGLLCRNCNMGIGFLKDNADYMEAAANYIRNYPVSEKLTA